MFLFIFSEQVIPPCFGFPALLYCCPHILQNIPGHVELPLGHTQTLLDKLDLVLTKGCAMCCGGILLVGTSVSDMRACQNKGGFVLFVLGIFQCPINSRLVIGIYLFSMPSIGLEPAVHVLAERKVGAAFDGYLVV